jgi:hypothetical protein
VEALEVHFQLTVVATRRFCRILYNPPLPPFPRLLSIIAITGLAFLVSVTLVTVDWDVAGEGELTDPSDPSVPDPRILLCSILSHR